MNNPAEFAAELVDHYLGARLDTAGAPAGLRETAIALLTDALAAGHVETLMSAQLDTLAHPSRTQWPDAYLAAEAAAEDALQQAAAGLRVAFAQAGHLGPGRSFEHGAAARLRDDPHAALRAELARVPRPLTRPEALAWSLDPAPWFSDSRREQLPWPPSGLASVAGLRALPGGATALSQVTDGPHTGWMQIGLIEQHRTPARRHPDQPARQVRIALGLEAVSDGAPSGTFPLGQAPWQLWTHPLRHLQPALAQADTAASERISTKNQALAALTDAGTTVMVDAPHRDSGLGLPLYVLAPAVIVVAALGLQPTNGICGFSLSDAAGEALVCRQWHGHLVHDGNYEPLLPAIAGADLLIRPDLFTRLRDTIGPTRCRTGISVHHMSQAQDDDLNGNGD
ncbi:hypothetical protein [Streptomyces sp. Tu102]|uniref:hypothetical protein n=1 Tax=Streptomyces TaxID=1883 RepID=UPI001BDCB0BC|nr:hypothetical protein [Streptomyces sp. Tu102]MBT1094208.1 hypothetical protein [Streptomyces sp. Tu102]